MFVFFQEVYRSLSILGYHWVYYILCIQQDQQVQGSSEFHSLKYRPELGQPGGCSSQNMVTSIHQRFYHILGSYHILKNNEKHKIW